MKTLHEEIDLVINTSPAKQDDATTMFKVAKMVMDEFDLAITTDPWLLNKVSKKFSAISRVLAKIARDGKGW